MSEKAMITKEVATAIQKWLLTYGDKEELIRTFCDGNNHGWVDEYEPLNNVGLITFVSALVNGYEVEATPEEKVREMYNDLIEMRKYAGIGIDRYARYDLAIRSVKCTLNTLGIKIEGVNA